MGSWWHMNHGLKPVGRVEIGRCEVVSTLVFVIILALDVLRNHLVGDGSEGGDKDGVAGFPIQFHLDTLTS